MCTLLTLTLLGCGPVYDSGGAAPPAFSVPEATLSESIPAVVSISFRAEGEGAWVRFGPAGEELHYQVAAELDEEGRWEAVLVGCPPEIECEYTVGLDEHVGPSGVITTGPGPDWIEAEVEGEGFSFDGLLAVAALTPQRGAVILDPRGRVVWWWPMPEGHPTDIVTRVRLDPDGGSIWFNQFTLDWEGAIEDSVARLVHVSLDGSWEDQLSVPDAHHDFLVLEGGEIIYLGLEDRLIDGELLRGDRLVRVSGGVSEELWSAWSSFSYDPSRHQLSPPTYWTLANHLEQAGDGWLMSLRNLETLLRLDGRGEELWRFGLEDAEIKPDTQFLGQHGFELEDDRLLLFDNAGDPRGSRVIEFTLDTEAHESTTGWTHIGEKTLILGDVSRLDDGDTLVAWGQAGRIEELHLDGAVQHSVTLGDGERPYPVGFLERITP